MKTPNEWAAEFMSRLNIIPPDTAPSELVAVIVGEAITEAIEHERCKGYGPSFADLVRAAESLAEYIVDHVRANTPDHTGIGVTRIVADNVAVFAAKAVAAEGERCAHIADDERIGENGEYATAAREILRRIREGK